MTQEIFGVRLDMWILLVAIYANFVGFIANRRLDRLERRLKNTQGR